MLELTGKCMGGERAIEFMGGMTQFIPEEIKTAEFMEEYESAINRFRYEVNKGIVKAPKIQQPKYKRIGELITCGHCGYSISRLIRFCPNCGTAALWKVPKQQRAVNPWEEKICKPILREATLPQKNERGAFNIPGFITSVAIKYFSGKITVRNAKNELVNGGHFIGGETMEETYETLWNVLKGNEKYYELV